MNQTDSNLDIVLFVPNLDGGIGRVISLLATGMHARGVRVEVWSAAQRSGYAEALEQQMTVRYLGNGSLRSAFFPFLRALRESKPKCVLSAAFHANCMVVIAAMLARTKSRIVIVDHPSVGAALQELAFIKRTLWRLLIRWLYPRADDHVAISEGVAKAMSEYGGIPASSIKIVPNPVISEEFFRQSAEPVEHPFFKTGEPILLYVGRLSKEKDMPNMLQAFALAQKQIPSRLIIVGDGPDKASLESLATKLGVKDGVSFVGHQANPYPYFRNSDVFVLSSTREGLPTVLVEALALGMKVVSTDCESGPREILKGGAYGKLVPVGDSVALSRAIVEVLREEKKPVPEGALEAYKVETAVRKYVGVALPQNATK